MLELFLKSGRVSTDTRTVQSGDLFFALKGDNFDGNQYAAQALEAGASLAIVDDPGVATSEHYHLVPDVLTALQELANAHRTHHKATFIGLTGSNGKTTTKELIREVLATTYVTQATRGNLNNHIGVPLTLLELKADTQVAIIEMGASNQGEIRDLCAIAQPDTGLITNIGEAHLEGFGGIEGVRKGKGELFDFLRGSNRPAFVNTDLPDLEGMAYGLELMRYNEQTLGIKRLANTTHLAFSWHYAGTTHEVHTLLTGDYNLPNAMAAIAIGLHMKVSAEDISKALTQYVPTNNRSQLQETAQNTLILDLYNANPSSMRLALQNLSKQEGDLFFIIGDMRELGEASPAAHSEIVALAQQLGLNGMLVGEHFGAVPSDFAHFPDSPTLLAHLEQSPIQGKMILMKGSRGIQLETAVAAL